MLNKLQLEMQFIETFVIRGDGRIIPFKMLKIIPFKIIPFKVGVVS